MPQIETKFHNTHPLTATHSRCHTADIHAKLGFPGAYDTCCNYVTRSIQATQL